MRRVGWSIQPQSSQEIVRKLMEPAVQAMVTRGELVFEEIARVATNTALEQAAGIAELFFIEERADTPPRIKERLERQNKVAAEIAFRIRAEKLRKED